MKIGEVRDKETAELERDHLELRRELWSLRHKEQTEGIDRPNRIRDIRRTIARILTVLKQRGDQGAEHGRVASREES